MATLKIEPASDGKLRVSLTRFSDAELARMRQIPGARWNSERKQWELPDTPETRVALADAKRVAMPPAPLPPMLAVKPKTETALVHKPREHYIAGKGKPLTTNPPHPLIKQADDELVLRGMAYLTRKSYGHLRSAELHLPLRAVQGFRLAYRKKDRARVCDSGTDSSLSCPDGVERARIRIILPGRARRVSVLLRDRAKTAREITRFTADETPGTIAARPKPRRSRQDPQGDVIFKAQGVVGNGIFRRSTCW